MSRTRYTVRREAARDLSRQAAWLKREAGAEIAERLLSAAQGSFGDLAQTPGLGTPVPSDDVRLRAMREWRVRGFPDILIFYVEREGGVAIIRVLHAARDWIGILDLS